MHCKHTGVVRDIWRAMKEVVDAVSAVRLDNRQLVALSILYRTCMRT